MYHAGRKIGRDLRCVRCGYNLRGLGYADHCPECNAPVSASLVRQGWLRFVTIAAPLAESDPRWARSIVSGMRWLAVAIAIQFLTPFVMELSFDPATGAVVRTMLAGACWIAFALGVVHVTRMDPVARDREVWTLRGVGGVQVLLGLIMLAPWPRVPNLLAIVYAGATFATTSLLHVHLGQLLRRLPSRSLRTVATIAGFILPFAACTAAVTASIASGGPPVFGPVSAVARLALPGGLDALLAHPGPWILKLFLVALGCTPVYFLILWHGRPRHGRVAEAPYG